MTQKTLFVLGALAVATLVGCAGGSGSAPLDYDKLAADITKSDFQPKGIVTLNALKQDANMADCSAANVAGKSLPEAHAKAIEAAALKSVKWPTDGKFLGDWKEGEKIAQSGRGMTWTDDAKTVNGGNCYNCHQIDKKEISYGTIGPSLWNYGKLRGVTNPAAPESKAMLEYTWGKIWNPQAYNACSMMPRGGHNGVLSQTQIQHLMALLLDPKSPVNQ
jgi:L-cysteine S-thiosulfotransferase